MFSDRFYILAKRLTNCSSVFLAIPFQWNKALAGKLKMCVTRNSYMGYTFMTFLILSYTKYLLLQLIYLILTHQTKSVAFYFLYGLFVSLTIVSIAFVIFMVKAKEMESYLVNWVEFLDTFHGNMLKIEEI